MTLVPTIWMHRMIGMTIAHDIALVKIYVF